MSKLKDILRSVGGALAVAVALSLLYLGGTMEFLESRLFDLRFSLAKRDAGDNIVLVTIDSASLKEVGVWPWPRTVHAQALDNIADSKPRIIAFNVDFSSASNPEADRHLESALARAGKQVILPAFVQTEGGNLVFTGPHPMFEQHVTIASINLFAGADGIVRELHREIRWRDGAMPTLAATLSGRGEGIVGRFYIDHGIDGGSFARVSFADVLYGRFDRDRLAGKTVIVGATAGELAQGIPTPQGAAVPGSIVHALATESLLQARALGRSPPLFGLIGIFLTVFTLTPFFSRRSWQQGLAATMGAAVAVFGVALAVQVLSPLLIDVVPWVISALATFGLGMVRLVDTQKLGLLAQKLVIGRKDAYVRGILEAAFDGVVAVDESGTIKSVNRRAVAMFGLDADELTGRKFTEFLETRAHAAFEGLLKGMAELDTAVEVNALRTGDEKFVAKLAVTGVPGDDGHALFVVVLLDVTALRQAEAEAADTRQRLTDSLEAISEGIALWDSGDRLLTCNARFAEFHAAVAHMLVPGCLFDDFVRDTVMLGAPPDALGRERDWIAARIERHRKPAGTFLQRTSEGGWLRTVERRTGNGEIICVEADVTDDQARTQEMAAARDAAEAASRAKTRFLANVSHELRTPLNAVIGFSDVMRDNALGSAGVGRYQDYAADIHNCGRVLLKMIDDMLELARIDSGAEQLDEGRVDLHDVVGECCELAEAGEKGRDGRFIIELAPGLPAIQADRGKISLCLRRLLDNAVGYSQTSDEITVSAFVDDDGGVGISVADSGSGMPSDDIARFMEPFGRESDPLVGARPGLGLGLALTNMEIQQHGGRLEINSETGRGTTATIHIPAWRVLTDTADRGSKNPG